MTYSEYDYPRKLTIHEVCFNINERIVYVRISDPYNNLSNQQIKNKAWKYIKESSRVVEVKRNI